jgi:hypothetical protein
MGRRRSWGVGRSLDTVSQAIPLFFAARTDPLAGRVDHGRQHAAVDRQMRHPELIYRSTPTVSIVADLAAIRSAYATTVGDPTLRHAFRIG